MKPLLAGQQTLFGAPATISNPPAQSSRHGEKDSWRELVTPQYLSRYVWIDVRGDGVYCLYCRHAVARGSGASGSQIFVSKPFVGTRPDSLSQHEKSATHVQSAEAYREWQIWSTQKTLEAVIDELQRITADGEAFCDALRCMYFF